MNQEQNTEWQNDVRQSFDSTCYWNNVGTSRKTGTKENKRLLRFVEGLVILRKGKEGRERWYLILKY